MDKGKLLRSLALLLVAVTGTGVSAAVAQSNGTTYGGTCLLCHSDRTGISDLHHLMVYSEGVECLDCHAMVKNTSSGQYSMQYRDEVCFLRCHTPTLARTDGPFIRLIPSDPYDSINYFPALTSNVKRKMSEAHHNNYGAPAANSQCGRCHAMVWDPKISAIVTVPVSGSAGTAGDVDNLVVVLDPDQLVYDARPGETIALSAGQSHGTGLSYTWMLHVGSTSAAALYLATGPELTYTIHRLTDPNTTNFLELVLKDSVGRYTRKYIAVNIHE